MPDMEKVEKLTSILEERSGLGVHEAVARSIHYLDGYESYLYSDEVKHLLELSMSRRSRRSDFEDLGASVFTKSGQSFLMKNIISDMMFFKKCNADF